MTTADDNGGFKVQKLSAENYFSWTFNMKMFLIGKDLWEIVTGTETLPGTASQEEQKRFKKRENLVLASVCLSVCTSLQIYGRTAHSVKEAWKNFQKHFLRKVIFPQDFLLEKSIFYTNGEEN